MPLAPIIGLGLYAMGMNKRMEDAEEAKAERELARRDRAALRGAFADVEPQVNAPGDGVGPSSFLANGVAVGLDEQARVQARTAMPENSFTSKIARAQGAMLQQGRIDDALKLRSVSDKLKAEGVDDFINGVMLRAPVLDDVKSGKVSEFDLDPTQVQRFNGVGKITIPQDAKGRWVTKTLANGAEEVDAEVIGPDGNPLAPSLRTIQMMAAMTPQQLAELRDKQFSEGKRLGMQQQSIDNSKAYQEGILRINQERAATYEKAAGKGGGRDRMSEVDKEEFDMQRDAAQKANEAIMRSQAEGTWEPEKNQSQFALMLQREKAMRKAQEILGRYRQAEGDASTTPADPYGVRARLDAMSPPKFDVSGNPAEFRKQLVGKVPPNVLAAFDKEHPGAGGPPSRPVMSQGVLGAPEPGQSSAPPQESGGIASMLGAMFSADGGQRSKASAPGKPAAAPPVTRGQASSGVPDKVAKAKASIQAQRRADADPEVTRLRKAVEQSQSGRAKRTAEGALAAYLLQHYGID